MHAFKDDKNHKYNIFIQMTNILYMQGFALEVFEIFKIKYLP